MAKLTDTQLIVLSKAAARDDGLATVPDGLNRVAASKVGTSLVSRKLLREVRCKPGMPVWREDEEGRGTSLVITREGREAIGIEQHEDSSSQGLRIASRDGDGANHRKARSPTTRAGNIDEPRPGSKQALLIKMLTRKSGATLDDEASLVRKIFADYLRLGSVAALAISLDAEGIRPKPRRLANGGSVQAKRFMVGPLAHMLKNRFYVGEVAYRGEVHPGEHEPIVDRAIFASVQAKLAEGSIARTLKRSQSPHLLTGLIFDDAGHPMSPTHANKNGVRYRYYVSHALLHGRTGDAGSTPRVAAAELEAAVIDALRPHLGGAAQSQSFDREVIQSCVKQVTVHPDHILLELDSEAGLDDTRIKIAFTPFTKPRKGIAYSPAASNTLTDETRDTLLNAILRSRDWIDAVVTGRISSLAQIAESEKLSEPTCASWRRSHTCHPRLSKR